MPAAFAIRCLDHRSSHIADLYVKSHSGSVGARADGCVFAIELGPVGERGVKRALEMELLHAFDGFVVRRKPHASLHENLTNVVKIKPQLQALPNQVRSHALYDELLAVIPGRDDDA